MLVVFREKQMLQDRYVTYVRVRDTCSYTRFNCKWRKMTNTICNAIHEHNNPQADEALWLRIKRNQTGKKDPKIENQSSIFKTTKVFHSLRAKLSLPRIRSNLLQKKKKKKKKKKKEIHRRNGSAKLETLTRFINVWNKRFANARQLRIHVAPRHFPDLLEFPL